MVQPHCLEFKLKQILALSSEIMQSVYAGTLRRQRDSLLCHSQSNVCAWKEVLCSEWEGVCVPFPVNAFSQECVTVDSYSSSSDFTLEAYNTAESGEFEAEAYLEVKLTFNKKSSILPTIWLAG